MAVRQQQRRGTASQWTAADPILSAAEIGYETDTNKFKIGDGTNRWATLNYFVDLNTTIAGAPGLLNSLDEIAAAIGDDPAFFTTVSTNLANHQADTTNIHGIANTALLVTQSDLSSALSGATVDQSALAGVGIDWNSTTEAFDIDSTVATKTYADGKASDAQTAAAADATSKVAAEATARATAVTAAIATASADATSKVAAEATARNTAINTAVANVVNAAPAALDTLKELADALTADESTAATLATLVGTKASSTDVATALAGKENALTSAEFTNKAITGVSGSSYGLVGTSEYLDVKDTNGYNKEIELDIAAVEAKLTTDGYAKQSDIATAKTAAEATASSDATSKANAAQSAAISAAATDATTKADAAKAFATAADTTLRTAVTTDIATAKTEAINTASTDASTKRDAAKTYADTAITTAVTNAMETTFDALALKAPLDSPALTGSPTAATAQLGSNSTVLATTAFVKAAIQDISSLNLVLDGGGV